MGFKAHSQCLTCVQQERSGLSGGVHMVVVLELCQGEQLCPVILSFIDKQPQVLFQLLVDLLHLSIYLRVIGSGWGNGDAQEAIELLHELGDKLGASV